MYGSGEARESSLPDNRSLQLKPVLDMGKYTTMMHHKRTDTQRQELAHVFNYDHKLFLAFLTRANISVT